MQVAKQEAHSGVEALHEAVQQGLHNLSKHLAPWRVHLVHAIKVIAVPLCTAPFGGQLHNTALGHLHTWRTSLLLLSFQQRPHLHILTQISCVCAGPSGMVIVWGEHLQLCKAALERRASRYWMR